MASGLLPADLAQFIKHEVAIGHYGSVEDVVCDGLRLLRAKQEKLEELRREIAPALEELDRGEGIEVKAEDMRAFLQGILDEVKAELELEFGEHR